MTLGGAEVKPVELAQAYNILANFGVKKDLKFIERIIDVNGNVLEKNEDNKGSYILGKNGEQAAFQIIDILSDKKSRILGFGEDTVLELNRKAAVKTGTTRNFKDNFAIGFTPDYLSLVWIGNADAKSMENISGITGAAPIWNSLMEEIHGNIPKKDFARPEGLVDVEICKLSGFLPTQLCSERVNEIFIQGTEPKEWDNMYQKLRIDPINNMLISDSCEVYSNHIEEKVFIVYPPELRRWAMEHNIPQPPIKTCETSNTETPKTIEISHPNNNDSFLIDKEVPINAQKIPLRANVKNDVAKVKWYINNKFSFETSEFPFTYLMDIEKFNDNCSLDKQINKIKCPIKARAEAYILEGGESVSNEVNFFLIY
ncbi:hypothetical protein A2483_01080 [Candidatus Peregrinibacteria bacterium RIFOXYC2_FULL_33_13]|nr:MAG: hypothetical protein A2483_01080 [Candidatus Peregrinibacteria bacterium RIFOXYC2_FULL_33_13]